MASSTKLFTLTVLYFTIIFAKVYAGLYSEEDDVLILNGNIFKKSVMKTDNLWFVQFYNSWCGHCQRFAPVWKNVASDVKDWSHVVKIAAIDCSEDENMKICRHYDIMAYPTIKYLGPNANDTYKGETFERSKGDDVDGFKSSLVKHLSSIPVKDRPESWPDLTPFREDSPDRLLKMVALEQKRLVLVIEEEDSILGTQLILDLSGNRKVLVRRATDSNTNLKAALDVSSVPRLVLFHPDGTKLLTQDFKTRTEYRDILRNELESSIYESVINSKSKGSTSIKKSAVSLTVEEQRALASVKERVYMVDLENGIWNALSHEIGGHQVIATESLSALKQFLSVLLKYFPGREPLMEYLKEIKRYVDSKENSIAGEDFTYALTAIARESSYTPERRPWIGCKGSKPHFRGYPCSLWSLFHLLTVSSVETWSSFPRSMTGPSEVLNAILGYVKHFFSCRECSQHFQAMAAEDMKTFVQEPDDSILWLWRAHNKANARLSGDLTEDPYHPKVQFPSETLCPGCRDESKWKESAILSFLKSFYSSNKLSKEGLTGEKAGALVDVGKVGDMAHPLKMNVKKIDMRDSTGYWSAFNSSDVTMCLGLYVLSGTVMIAAYFLFIVKKRYKKKNSSVGYTLLGKL